MDQRRACRLPVAMEQDEAELRWRGANYPVRLIDQSSGGFGIQLSCAIEIAAQEVAALTWTQGCTRVRVINRLDDLLYVRLGLERLEDLFEAEEIDPPESRFSLLKLNRHLPGKDLSQYVLGLAIVLGCAVAGLAWEFMPKEERATLQAPHEARLEEVPVGRVVAAARKRAVETLDSVTAFANEQTTRAPALKILPPGARRWVAQRMQVLSGAARGVVGVMLSTPVDVRRTTAAIEQTAEQTAKSLSRAAGHANEALIQTLPRFISLLELSPTQQRQIDGILKQARDASQSVQRRSKELGTQETMRAIDAIRQEAGDKVLAALSPSQAAQLRTLMAGSWKSEQSAAPGKPVHP